jgi:hypothetical protein
LIAAGVNREIALGFSARGGIDSKLRNAAIEGIRNGIRTGGSGNYKCTINNAGFGIAAN